MLCWSCRSLLRLVAYEQENIRLPNHRWWRGWRWLTYTPASLEVVRIVFISPPTADLERWETLDVKDWNSQGLRIADASVFPSMITVDICNL